MFPEPFISEAFPQVQSQPSLPAPPKISTSVTLSLGACALPSSVRVSCRIHRRDDGLGSLGFFDDILLLELLELLALCNGKWVRSVGESEELGAVACGSH